MSTFANFKSLFTPDIGRAFPTDPFVQIDRDQAIRRLDLDKRAAKNGALNYPAPDSPGLDDVEQEIVAEIQQYATRSQSEAAANHQVYGQRLSELSLLRELANITAAKETALGNFSNLVINVRGRLSLAADQVSESYCELVDFKSEHGLKRPAHEGIRGIVAWSTFLISVTVETALNSQMLRVNDDFGYVGGIIAAAIIAAVNVGISACVGSLVFPYLHHKRIAIKLLATASSVFWFAGIFCLNLLAAHFRDAKVSGLFEHPDQQALVTFLSTPFQLDGIYSYLLLLAGLLFSIIAALAAFKMKDPYPGYGDLYNRHEKRCHEYADEIEDATDELTAIRDDEIFEATATRSELGIQFRERGRIIVSRDHHRIRYRDHQKHLEQSCNSLLEYYRNKNVQARPDGNYPEHFRIPWRLHESELPHPSDEPTTEAEVKNAEIALSDAITHIASAYNDAIHSFKHLDALKQELRHG